MNCPKCGNYIEDGKEYCFMCGTKLGGSDFSLPGRMDTNPSLNEDYYKKKEEYNNRLKNYRDVEIKRGNGEKRDFLDFYSDFRIFFKLGGLLFVLVIAFLVFSSIAKKNNMDIELKPVIQDLYYRVNDKLTNTTSGNGANVYSLNNNKGTSCSIIVYLDNSNTSDHVGTYFSDKEENLVPSYDTEGNVEDSLAIPLFQKSLIKINGGDWYYLNVFYKKNLSEDFVDLKYRYLSAAHNGLFYNIELANYDNSQECNSLLDSFLRSLQFVD